MSFFQFHAYKNFFNSCIFYHKSRKIRFDDCVKWLQYHKRISKKKNLWNWWEIDQKAAFLLLIYIWCRKMPKSIISFFFSIYRKKIKIKSWGKLSRHKARVKKGSYAAEKKERNKMFMMSWENTSLASLIIYCMNTR